MYGILIGLFAFAVTWFSVPFIMEFAVKWNFVDIPNSRKIHKNPIPLLGGIGIFLGFLAAVQLTKILGYNFDTANIAIISGSFLLVIIGLIDDYYKTRGKDFPALPRLLVQILAAYLVVHFSGGIVGLSIPFTESKFISFSPEISILLTIVWIVMVINVFNFLDGLDGLAAGIAVISAATLACVALVKGELTSFFWAVALAGAALGFLKHNFFPARIIMGDAGSTLIGFLLGSISVIGTMKSATVFSIFIPVFALGVPIIDGLRVIIQRTLKGQAPYNPDKTHGHHKLLQAGFSQSHAVMVLYLIGTCCSLISIVILLLDV
ncbi:MraY family glycosyltransferase [Bacillus sp. JJ927]|uniref:MraY family glycosyltransferase n=1 Tax=Bacillus sp. JJ927 TaxID=3122976 RepID=UPI00256FFCF7|nr:MraY family glycosyltransferase [Bacillus cereus]